MTTHDFFEQLDARIAKYDLLCHPFYKAWAAGDLSREDLQAYGREYFHHVEAFPAYLTEFASRLPQGGLRKAVLANRDDEMGGTGGGSHAELWLDFVAGMGGGRSAEATPKIPEVSRLLAFFHSVANDRVPEKGLAAFYAYESQVPRVAAEKARGLGDRYGADEKTCAYFTLHATADVYHSRVWRTQLENAIEGNAAAAERALGAWLELLPGRFYLELQRLGRPFEETYIGAACKRKEDPRFLTGASRFTDDIVLGGQLHGVVVRSPHAHARIRSVDVAAARSASGVRSSPTTYASLVTSATSSP